MYFKGFPVITLILTRLTLVHYNSHQNDNAAERESRTIEELLDWLNYAGMDERREEVERAHRNTFKWIFDGSRADTADNAGRQHRPNFDSTQPKNTAFVAWLRKETGAFWIHGKPGAGKSTLMKCIMDDPRLEEHANVWAGSYELSISSFYFWKLGSKLQKSLCGLYRALLWQMLKDDRSLAREAFPGWQANFNTTELGEKALRAALNRLIKACAPRKRYLILIDGLDEYEDAESDTTISEERLSQDILQMVKSGSVKVIVASRPHRVFKCNFSHGRNLAIHDLTAWDLELYAHDRLLEDERIRPFGESVSAMERAKLLPLVRMIVQGSHGVFLWARVAVDLARVHIRYYHDLDRLEGILEKLHPDIEELFDQIMGMILNLRGPEKIEGLRYLALTSRWFATTASRPDGWLPISILGIGCELSGQRITESWLQDNRKRLTAIGHNEPRSSGRVESYCFGLLEISTIEGGARGDFLPNATRTVIKPLHRTLMEYLSSHGAIQSAQNLASPDHESFDANIAILLGLIVMEDHIYPLVSMWTSSTLCLLEQVLIFNKLAEESTESAQIALLFAFDRTMEAGFTALVGRCCHLDHDHEASCCSRSPGFGTLTRTDKDYVFQFENLAERFALNPYHPLIPRKSWPEGFLDLLAITITRDANALLKHWISTVISNDAPSEAIVSAKATHLLDFALNKRNLLDMVLYPDEPNLEALQLLLRIGACPDTRLDGASAWEKFLDHMLSQTMEYLRDPIIEDEKYRWHLKALQVLFSHGVRQSVHRIWAVILEEPGQSPRLMAPKSGERQVLEFRRYSVVQIVRQVVGLMHQAYNAAQLDSLHNKRVWDRRAYNSEMTELEKMRSQLEAQETDSAPTPRFSWSGLEVGIGPFPLDNVSYEARTKLRKAMATAHRTGCDISEYQEIRVVTSPAHDEEIVATWLPHGCRETRELPSNLVPSRKSQSRIDRLTLQDGKQAGFDVVGWFVF